MLPISFQFREKRGWKEEEGGERRGRKGVGSGGGYIEKRRECAWREERGSRKGGGGG